MKHMITTILMLISISLPVVAQGAPPATPIDGGLSLALIGTGVALGYRQMKRKANK